MAVVNRNADKLRVLENMPEAGSSEALDQFLATFVAQNSKVSTCHTPSPRELCLLWTIASLTPTKRSGLQQCSTTYGACKHTATLSQATGDMPM
jgi:hypothetical protein